MLSPAERRALRARAHPLKPVVLLGQQGLTPGVFAAIDEALTAHELIKIRLRGIEREARDGVVGEISGQAGAEVINLIGHILTLYRARPEAPAAAPPPRKKARAKPAGGRARATRAPRDPWPAPPRRGDARSPRSSPTRRGPK